MLKQIPHSPSFHLLKTICIFFRPLGSKGVDFTTGHFLFERAAARGPMTSTTPACAGALGPGRGRLLKGNPQGPGVSFRWWFFSFKPTKKGWYPSFQLGMFFFL